jgi:hypothetical protein
MKRPALTHRDFEFLSPFLDGKPWRLNVVVKELQWNRAKCAVSLVLTHLQERGLVERVRWGFERRASRHLPRPIGYRITPAGKRAWAESADYYLYFIKRFGNPATSNTGTRHPGEPEGATAAAPLVDPPAGPDRRPTSAEAAALLAASPPWLAHICRAVWCDELALETLVTLDVTDVDLAKGAVSVPDGADRRLVRMSHELCDAAGEAIGNRRAGPLFRNLYGERLLFRRALKAFTRVRDRVGIPRNVKLRGRAKHDRDEAA